MLYPAFITEFDHIRSTYFDRRLSKELLEECVHLLKVKTEEEEVNDATHKSWYDWFRLECMLILTGKTPELLPSNDTRRVATKEFDIGLLFVLNKLFAAWNLKQGEALSLKWEAFLHAILPVVIRSFKNEKKERDHANKLMTVWETGKFFSKEALHAWKYIDVNSEIPTAASTASTDHSTTADSLLSKKKRKLDDADETSSTTTAATTATKEAASKEAINKSSSSSQFSSGMNPSSNVRGIERQESSDGPEPITDLRSATIHTMHQFTHAMCQQYFDSANSSTDKVYWRLFEITAFYLLHKLTIDFEFGEDEAAMCLASLYLSGKIENMFLKTEKLRSTAEAMIGKYFGSSRATPSDEEILRYETDLLQLIKYDINMIKNPIKFSQDMNAKGELDKTIMMGIVVIAGKEEYLAERRYFEFPPAVSACVLFMMLQCRDVKVGESAMMRTKLKPVFDSELFRSIDDQIQLIEMMSKVRKHSVDILRDCSTFYDQFLELFQRYSEIPIENIPAEYLYRKATASQ